MVELSDNTNVNYLPTFDVTQPLKILPIIWRIRSPENVCFRRLYAPKQTIRFRPKVAEA
jgi:hypothetical protein